MKEFTAIITKIDEHNYIGQCIEVPEALTQGSSQAELLDNLKDAVLMVLETKKVRGFESYCSCKYKKVE